MPTQLSIKCLLSCQSNVSVPPSGHALSPPAADWQPVSRPSLASCQSNVSVLLRGRAPPPAADARHEALLVRARRLRVQHSVHEGHGAACACAHRREAVHVQAVRQGIQPVGQAARTHAHAHRQQAVQVHAL